MYKSVPGTVEKVHCSRRSGKKKRGEECFGQACLVTTIVAVVHLRDEWGAVRKVAVLDGENEICGGVVDLVHLFWLRST